MLCYPNYNSLLSGTPQEAVLPFAIVSAPFRLPRGTLVNEPNNAKITNPNLARLHRLSAQGCLDIHPCLPGAGKSIKST